MFGPPLMQDAYIPNNEPVPGKIITFMSGVCMNFEVFPE